jgi:hypothetical protein
VLPIDALAVSPKPLVEVATPNRSVNDRSTCSPVPTTMRAIVALLFAVEFPNDVLSPEPSAILSTATPPVVASPAEIDDVARVPTNEPAPSAKKLLGGAAVVPENAWLIASAVPGVLDPVENVCDGKAPKALLSEIVAE